MDEQYVIDGFRAAFDALPELIARAPGRVNLIGEHTDYNDGYVLPMALDMGTTVAASRRSDGLLRVLAPRVAGKDVARLDDLRPREGPEWTRFVRGVAALLLAGGCAIPGADLLIDGDLPLSAGLSSSASLEVGVAAALMGLAGCPVERVALARLGQRVENQIVGLRSGIMDQLAVACGVAGYALLIDCRTLAITPVALPPDARVLVIDSGVPRALAASAYNQRRAECESALGKLRVARPDLQALRDVEPELLAAEAWRLDRVELGRARHVVGENRRVLESLAALSGGDVAGFGALMSASHRSLRDDYEVSGPELDRLVELALATPGVFGARLTGAGFGGCVVALVETPQADAAAAGIVARYRQTTIRTGRAYVCLPGAGVRVEWVEREQASENE